MTPGTRLGPYENPRADWCGRIVDVYETRDTRLDRRVATRTADLKKITRNASRPLGLRDEIRR